MIISVPESVELIIPDAENFEKERKAMEIERQILSLQRELEILKQE